MVKSHALFFSFVCVLLMNLLWFQNVVNDQPVIVQILQPIGGCSSEPKTEQKYRVLTRILKKATNTTLFSFLTKFPENLHGCSSI